MTKKRMVWIAVLTALFTSLAFAQEAENRTEADSENKAFNWAECWKNYGGTVKDGQFIINAGIGATAFSVKNMNGDEEYHFPYFELSAEYAKKIWVLPFSFGAYFGYARYGWKENVGIGTGTWSSYACNRDFYHFGALAKYHVQMPLDKLDLYAGLKLGLRICHDNWERQSNLTEKKSDAKTECNFEPDFIIGASYYFTDLIGANIETGFPLFAKASVSFKF